MCMCFFTAISIFSFAEGNAFIRDGKPTDAYNFAKNCHHATTRSVTFYADDDLTQPIATVPAQTFVNAQPTAKPLNEDGTRMAQYFKYITYPGGIRGEGWAENGRSVGNFDSAYTVNGLHLLDVKLKQEGLYSNPYYEVTVPDNDERWGDLKGDSGGSNTGKQSNSSSSGKTGRVSSGKSSKTSAAPAVSHFSVKQGENKENEVRVEVLILGSASSRVKVSGATTEVATDDLLLDGVAVGDRLAWIYAPRQGYCSLRSKASDNGKVLKKCRAGYLVVVLEKGQEYTKINYQGTDGYVLNGCLKYIDETQQPTGTGTIIYSKKKPNVRTTINIRNNADGKSKKVAEWKTGTEVPVYSHPDGWYEVEYDGVRGYIMEKYLQLNE